MSTALSVVEVYRRLDETIAASSSCSTDCKAGCSYACHIRVVAQPHETFHTVDYMQTKFRPERIRHVLGRARKNRKRIDPLTYERHPKLILGNLQNRCCFINLYQPKVVKLIERSAVNSPKPTAISFHFFPELVCGIDNLTQ